MTQDPAGKEFGQAILGYVCTFAGNYECIVLVMITALLRPSGVSASLYFINAV